VEEIIYGARALVRYLPPYSLDFNAIEGSYHQAKDFIQENDIAFHCCLKPRAFILHAFAQFHQKSAKGISETVVMSDYSTDRSNKFEPFR